MWEHVVRRIGIKKVYTYVCNLVFLMLLSWAYRYLLFQMEIALFPPLNMGLVTSPQLVLFFMF